LQNSFQQSNSKNRDIVELMNGIKRSFNPITTFNLPHPGDAVDTAKEDTFDWNLTGLKHNCFKLFVN